MALFGLLGCVLASSIDEALSRLSQPPYLDLVETVWVVGGVGIYREAISHPRCFRIYLTQVRFLRLNGTLIHIIIAPCLTPPTFLALINADWGWDRVRHVLSSLRRVWFRGSRWSQGAFGPASGGRDSVGVPRLAKQEDFPPSQRRMRVRSTRRDNQSISGEDFGSDHTLFHPLEV